MPWSHCQVAQIPDSQPCPSCGAAKGNWTIRFDATRVFRMGGNPCKIQLLDQTGAGIEAAYRIELPDGKVVEGALDAAGNARAKSKDPGEATVSFPDLEGVTSTSGAKAGPAAGTFLCPLGKELHTFRVEWGGDEAAQVDTLVRAAADGTPFCEECARGTDQQVGAAPA